jgi:Cys-tRNA(Pro)/Cys-tRNA(Cys) deacylase
VVGGISPFGQKKKLFTVVDESATELTTMFVSGGRRGLDIEVAPADLLRVLDAKTGAIANTDV